MSLFGKLNDLPGGATPPPAGAFLMKRSAFLNSAWVGPREIEGFAENRA